MSRRATAEWTVTGADAPSTGIEREVYTVSELTTAIRLQLEDDYPDVWIQGEISNLRVPTSRHAYFSLKDADAQLRSVCFRGVRQALRFDMADGLEVLVRGRVSVYEPRGEYQLVAVAIEPLGVGALQLAYQQLRERLTKEGLFAEERKRPLPVLPQHIGVVTSETGAAFRDILNVLDRRFSNLHVVLAPTRVQGDGAAQDIATAIEQLNRHGEVEVLIVGRGGGSLEDLWAFNEEVLARAIVASNIPVISAVGHEIDWTIADHVADLRAPTPSAAAELVVGQKLEWVEHLRQLLRRLATYPTYRVAQLQQRLDTIVQKLHVLMQHTMVLSRSNLRTSMANLLAVSPVIGIQRLLARLSVAPQLVWRTHRERYERLCMRVGPEMQRHQQLATTRLGGLAARLASLSPVAVLARGYSVTKDSSGRVVHSTRDVAVGQDMTTHVADGQISSTVVSIDPRRQHGNDASQED